MTNDKLFLIDGSAIFYRSYFAFIRNPLINSKGENISTTFGFLNTIFRIIEDEKPAYFAIIFDTKEPTFRHNIYIEYKATREKMPEEMSATFPRLIQVLQTLNMIILDKEGFEADDIIATLARKNASDDLQVFIVSGDKDLAQLINENIKIYASAKSSNLSPEILGKKEIKEKYGVYPEEIIDWLSLMGDKSDNIPGIPSVGEKTATKLIEEFKTLDKILDNPDAISKKNISEKIREYRQQAILSKQLVTLDDNVPLDSSIQNLKLKSWNKQELEVLLKDMESNRLINRAATVLEIISDDKKEQEADSYSPQVNYILINNRIDFDKLLDTWKNIDQFVFDLETDSLDTFIAKIAGISVSFEEDTSYYIAINHSDSQLEEHEVLDIVRPIFENKDIRKIGQNIKFDTMILRQHGINVENLYFDTMIASYLINSSSSQHNIDNLAMEYLNYKKISTEEIIGSGKKQIKMTDLLASEVYRYACEDADITLKLKNIFEPKLNELDLENLFYNIEMPLVQVLLEMEEHGVTLDLELLSSLSKELESKIESLKNTIYEQAEEEFNINSPQQLGVILFDKLEIHKELNMRKPKRTKTGQYSTAEAVMERYHQHQLPKNILDYRSLIKLKNTYVDALPDLINKKTGRVHTSFNQTIAATGRLSSVKPNLQNIPIRTEIGSQMRKAFIPAEEGSVIMSADYSQIELRIMAHLAHDETMINSFKQDLDIHSATASQIFKVPIGEVNQDYRRKAKAINFGIIYGMSKYGLSNRLEISLEEAEQFIYDYFSTYTKIQDFMRETIEFADKHGYVLTMKNRRRYLPQIKSTNRQLREFAERTSINTPIQGTAADLIKLAMINIKKEMNVRDLQSKMILQVHDELVFEVPDIEIEEMKSLVKEKMGNAIKLDVSVKVDIGIGKNWLEAH